MGKTKRKPLTIEELRALKTGDWVWLVADKAQGYAYKLEPSLCSPEKEWLMLKTYYNFRRALTYANYGTKWVAYKNKEEAENAGYGNIKQIIEEFRNQIATFTVYEAGCTGIECVSLSDIDKLIDKLYGKED